MKQDSLSFHVMFHFETPTSWVYLVRRFGGISESITLKIVEEGPPAKVQFQFSIPPLSEELLADSPKLEGGEILNKVDRLKSTQLASAQVSRLLEEMNCLSTFEQSFDGKISWYNGYSIGTDLVLFEFIKENKKILQTGILNKSLFFFFLFLMLCPFEGSVIVRHQTSPRQNTTKKD